MPSAFTYPGVYVEEIPSGVHTITGVATSITAFIGAAETGPIGQTLTINSFADFERIFGGLWLKSNLGFAVRDFFLNGGAQAVIVRLFHGETDPAAAQKITVGALKFIAASPGKWGANLRVTIDTSNLTDDIAASLGVTKADLFNLTVRDSSPGGAGESFGNLTVKDSARRVDKVLTGGSSLLRYDGVPNAGAAIAAGTDALGALEVTLATAQKALSDKLNADPSANVAAEKAARDGAKTALDAAVLAASTALLEGVPLASADFLPANGQLNKKGLYALEQADLFNLLCIPPYRASTDALDVDVNLVSVAAAYCETRRAMLIVDAPKDWISKDVAKTRFNDPASDNVGTKSRNAALFFPRLKQPNPLHNNQMEIFAACGTVAGIFARTDTQRGVWKAPAGLDASLVGTPALGVLLTDAENGELNPLGINCLRSFPAAGRVVWGARTLRGNDQLADEYKYIPVRRTALFIEESLYRGLQWAVFEPNDEPLWGQIRLNAGSFMQNLFRQGAFEGSSAKDAYFVKCDKDTTTQNDINLGIVNVVVGFAPLKPAEFVVIKIQQMAGQLAV
jgi:phage tail sheath protein FI